MRSVRNEEQAGKLQRRYFVGRRCATATAMVPSGRRYFPSRSQVTGSPVGNEQMYSGSGGAVSLRFMTKRRCTRQVDRSGSLTMTSANRVPEAIVSPS